MLVLGCSGEAGSASAKVLELIVTNFLFSADFSFMIFVLIQC